MRRFLESNWSQIAPKLRQRFDNIGKEDLRWENVREHQFLRKLALKLDMSEQQLLKEMKTIITE